MRSIIARHDARLQPSASPARGGTLVGGILLLGCLLLPSDLPAEPRIGVGELNSLIAQHAQKQNPQSSGKPLTAFEQRLPLSPEGPPVTFLILGFENYHCGRCHRAERLVEKAARRMRGVLERLRREIPLFKKIPLRQYIIQPYADSLLQRGQMAHATFDTIRISPATILIDKKVYDGATHLHETLHLTQPFLGPVNELEAIVWSRVSSPVGSTRMLVSTSGFLTAMGGATALGFGLAEWPPHPLRNSAAAMSV